VGVIFAYPKVSENYATVRRNPLIKGDFPADA
jgi:hypothetical protein